MNTPKSRKPERFVEPKGDGAPVAGPPIFMTRGLPDQKSAALLGNIVAQWTHLEDSMIDVLAVLLGEQGQAAAQETFRAINSSQARLKVMRTLLEGSPINSHRSAAYDEILDEFDALTKLRNQYVHGLWWTEHLTARRSDPVPPHYGRPEHSRPVTPEQMEAVLTRIARLDLKILAHLQQACRERGTSPRK